MILIEARKWFREMAPGGTANPQGWQNQPSPMRGLIGTVTQRKGRYCKPSAVAEPATPVERSNWGYDPE